MAFGGQSWSLTNFAFIESLDLQANRLPAHTRSTANQNQQGEAAVSFAGRNGFHRPNKHKEAQERAGQKVGQRAPSMAISRALTNCRVRVGDSCVFQANNNTVPATQQQQQRFRVSSAQLHPSKGALYIAECGSQSSNSKVSVS